MDTIDRILGQKNEQIKKLEEENKNLKDNVEFLHSCLDDRDKSIAIMQEENEKLKKYYDRDKEELMESCYSLAKENDKLKSDLMEDMKEITKLEKENKKLKEKQKILDKENCELIDENVELKSDLSECECSFGFENDEVGFWKQEYKRLKKWIKDHCKGYGNLFPEDEMKRQWKKADKKRKLKGMLMEEDTLQELRDIGEI